MTESSLLKLGSNIRQNRLQKGWSQEKLGEVTGLHRTYIGGIERGERNVSINNLIKIAKVLGISVSQLVIGID